jgi:O-antigen ligase
MSLMAVLGNVIPAFAIAVALLLLPELRLAFPSVLDSTAGMKLLVGAAELVFALSVFVDRRNALPRLREIPGVLRVCLAGWLLWSVAATATAVQPAVALVRQAEWVAHLLFAVAVWSWVGRDPRRGRYLFAAVAAGFVLYVALFALAVALYVDDVDQYPWPSGVLGFSHIRHFGYYAMVAVVASCGPMLGDRHRVTGRVLLAFVAMTVAWASVFWAGGRGPIVAFAASLAVIMAVLGLKKLRFLLLALSISGVVGAVLSLPLSVPGLGLQRFYTTAAEASNIAEYSTGRFGLWSESLPVLADHPWLGVGPDGWSFATVRESAWLVQPHNLVIQAAADWGIPGVLLFLCVLVGTALVVVGRVRSRQESSPPSAIVGFWLATALALFALFDGTLYHSYPTMFFMLGLSVAFSEQKAAAKTAQQGLRAAAIAAGTLTALVFALHWESLRAITSPSVPPPGSDRVRVLQRFPSATSLYQAPYRLSAWAVEWFEQGQEPEAYSWLDWVAAHTTRPWIGSFTKVDLLRRNGRIEEAKAVLRRLANGQEPDYVRDGAACMLDRLEEVQGRGR